VYKAVKSFVAYPDGITRVQLTEGEEVNLSPAFCEFLLERKLIQKPTKRTTRKK